VILGRWFSMPDSSQVLEYESRPTAGEAGGASTLRLRGHVPVLDGVRGLAIVLVLLVHFTPPGQSHTILGAMTKALASVGNVGVDLFFVLSGFLITGILLDAKGGPHYFRTFYARRSLRIFPLYYGVLLVTFVILPRFYAPRAPDAPRIFHEQGWLWLYGSNVKGGLSDLDRPFSSGWYQFDHFWSLAVEEQFYLVWPLMVLLLNRRGMMALCVVLAAVALGIRYWLFYRNDQTLAFYTMTPCRIDELATGGLIALVARSSVAAARLQKMAPILFVVSGVVLAAVWSTDFRAYVIGGTLLSVFFGSLIVVALSPSLVNPIRAGLNLYPVRLLGKFSYAMYVLHPFLLAVLTDYLSYQRLGSLVHSAPVGVVLFLVIGFAVTLAAGWLSWHLYEKHFLKLKRFVEYRK